MFSISTLIKRAAGDYLFYPGLVTPLPLELRDLVRERRYAAIDKAGWTTGEFGYYTYSLATKAGDFIIVPGLMLSDKPKVIKKFHGYRQEFTVPQIERYAEGIANFEASAIDMAQSDLNMLVHDLRRLSMSILHSATEATRLLYVNPDEALRRIENIKASQGMLKIRTDVLDFLGNPAALLAEEALPVYRKVDKVTRLFKSDALTEHKQVNLTGRSLGSTYGPDVLEIIPYTLLDNAIKYSPPTFRTDIMVSDEANSIDLIVQSYGPRIEQDEREGIFEKGARGKHARAAGHPGTGVGLYLVRQLVVDHFGGSISCDQGDGVVIIDGVAVYPTIFTVSFPYARERY